MFLPKPLLPLLVIAALGGLSPTPGHAQQGNKKISIAVIPKGTTHAYWKGVEAGKDFISYVSTDNRGGGRMAGEELARLVGENGKVIVMRFAEGQASTTERGEGCLEAIKKHPGIKILVDNRYAGATTNEAQNTAMNIIDKIRQADGIFCPEESSTFGFLLALRQNHLAGKVKLVGFDTAPPLIEAIQKGAIQALLGAVTP